MTLLYRKIADLSNSSGVSDSLFQITSIVHEEHEGHEIVSVFLVIFVPFVERFFIPDSVYCCKRAANSFAG